MRKHHNKLYYSKYRVKSIFNLPGSLMFYPTNDKYLTSLKLKNVGLPTLHSLADFIIKNRNSMKFRFQDKKAIFYTNENLANELNSLLGNYYLKTEIVDPKFSKLKKDTVGCNRLPHGKYKYQIHLKKDLHKYLSQNDKDSLWNYIERNVDHCLVTNRYLLDYLEGKSPFCYQGYFYVTEQKIITPIYMIAQKGIDKVIKFVKVKNASHKKTTRT